MTEAEAKELAEFTEAVDSAASTAGTSSIFLMIILSSVVNKVWNLINLL